MEEKHSELFRKKSLEAIRSPEALNDYLKVTSPGIWLFLAAVTALLVGVILWGSFGSIDTSVQVALVSDGDTCVCYVPYDKLSGVLEAGIVTAEGADYALGTDIAEPEAVSDTTSASLRIAGDFDLGDIIAALPVEGDLPEGVYTGSVTTERLQPISLLLQ